MTPFGFPRLHIALFNFLLPPWNTWTDRYLDFEKLLSQSFSIVKSNFSTVFQVLSALHLMKGIDSNIENLAYPMNHIMHFYSTKVIPLWHFWNAAYFLT